MCKGDKKYHKCYQQNYVLEKNDVFCKVMNMSIWKYIMRWLKENVFKWLK